MIDPVNKAAVWVNVITDNNQNSTTHTVNNNKPVVGSLIGSPKEIREMLDFSAKHSVFPDIKQYPMKIIND